MQKIDLIVIRNYKEEDKNFILSTFLRGVYYGCAFFTEVPKDIFMYNYHAYIEKLLASPSVEIKVACLKDDEDVMLGYSVTRTVQDQNICDFVFVKSAWRGIGIAKSLITKPLHVVTHLTRVGKVLKPKETVYNPFI